MKPTQSANAKVQELWPLYAEINPQAQRIQDLLKARGEEVLNDHIALRTWNIPGYSMDDLARPFEESGYVVKGQYVFRDKHLTAKHWQHPDPKLPKVFISQIEWRELSPGSQSILQGIMNQLPSHPIPMVCNSGRCWNIRWVEYEALARESEYASWLAAWGFVANHFTVSAQSMKTFSSLLELNRFLKSHGFLLNQAGGEIKGSIEEGLQQSSTLAAMAKVQFMEGPREIPGCYYEFAWRHAGTDGRLFQGFLEKSADKIFESTDRSAQTR